MPLFNHVLINGVITPMGQASIPVTSLALQHGYGVYEAIQVEQHKIFHLDDHLERLFNSAAMIELRLEPAKQDIAGWCKQLNDFLQEPDFTLRLLALAQLDAREPAVLVILPQTLPKYPSSLFENGGSVITFKGCRSMPQCKSLNTLINYLARRKAMQAGVQEALLLNDGELTEGARTNLFVLQNGVLLTPPLDRVLSGITRDIVLRLARENHFPVLEKPLLLAELASFDEMFITSTSMHIMPVTRVDDKQINSGKIGQNTRKLMKLFNDYYNHIQSF
jgi:branched-subunit amino acid aminotransferase/4-amino-4-deoxychorismate lyase